MTGSRSALRAQLVTRRVAEPGNDRGRARGPVHPGARAVDRTNLSYDFGDLPATDIAYDAPSGDLYASTDFGVSRLESAATTWKDAASGTPSGLTDANDVGP